MKNLKRSVVVLSCVFFIAGFSGCDQLTAVKNAIVEYFKGDASVKVEKAAPVKTKKQEVKKMTPNTLAIVGQWSITQDEFKERLKAIKELAPKFNTDDIEAKKMVLDELINQQVIVEEAEKTGLTKSKDILAALDEFKRTLLVREMARKIVQGLSVTDDEVAKFYNENKSSMTAPFEYRVREIVVASNEKAQDLLTRIKGGGNFAELAKKNSISKSAATGGDLGFIKEEPFPEMATALLKLGQGETSDVFKGPEGFYIVKLEEKKGGEQYKLEDIKEDLRQDLLLMKQKKAIVDYLNKLKEKYKIEKNEALL